MAMIAPPDEVFIEPIGRVLTGEEYDALPENPRRELVDGVIHIMASPRAWHQRVKIGIYNVLNRLLPREVALVEELEVRFMPPTCLPASTRPVMWSTRPG